MRRFLTSALLALGLAVLWPAGAALAQSCGGIETYEKAIATRRFRPVAMSVLASGAITPREAIEYVCAQPKIESIVFGASSRGNIRQTKALIDECSAATAVAA